MVWPKIAPELTWEAHKLQSFLGSMPPAPPSSFFILCRNSLKRSVPMLCALASAVSWLHHWSTPWLECNVHSLSVNLASNFMSKKVYSNSIDEASRALTQNIFIGHG